MESEIMKEAIPYTDNVYKNPNNQNVIFNCRTREQPIYRLLDNKQWIDNFFDKGELSLSCILKFRNYPGEIQGDREEGSMSKWFYTDFGIRGLTYESGLNGYILCTSLQLTAKIKNDFNAVGAIKIINPTYFALEVMSKINDCTQTIKGKCNYVNSRAYKGQSEKMREILEQDDYLNNPLFQKELLNSTFEDELFLKRKLYESQDEYRMIWFKNEIISDAMLINCPEAIRHCQRIDF